MFNTDLFKAACLESGKTPEDLAPALGITADSLKRKIRTGKLEVFELTKLTIMLGLDEKRSTQIFQPDLYDILYGPGGGDCPPAPFSAPKDDTDPPSRGWAVPRGDEPEPAGDGTLCDEGGDDGERLVPVFEPERPDALYRSVCAEVVLGPAGKEFYNVEDFMEMTGQCRESCQRLMRRIKRVSDVTRMSGVVHRVDYVKYLQFQLDRNARRDTRK